MTKQVVISQSMYFPWVGLLEQIKLADVFIHYDDVQLTRGFYNRVQVKTSNGMKWLTVPICDHRRGQNIDEALVDDRRNWRRQHRELLRQSYMAAPYRDDMLALVDSVFSQPVSLLSDISRLSVLALAEYFELKRNCLFFQSREFQIEGRSTQRLHDLVVSVGGDVYITGHGARNYLNHELFEESGIAVRYMNYQCNSYPQLHGEFTPYVTALDLVANCGRDGGAVIQSTAIDWKEFCDEPSRAISRGSSK